MSNNITVNKVTEVVEELQTEILYPLVDGNSAQLDELVSIKPINTLDNATIFIDRVVNACFTNDDYSPECLELMTFTTFLQMCTNINIPKTKDNYLDLNLLQKWSNYISILDNAREFKWFNNLERSIAEKISFRKQQVIANGANEKLEQMQISIDEITSNFVGLISGVTDLFVTVSDKIATSDLQGIVAKIAPIIANLTPNSVEDDEDISAEVSE